MAEFERVENCCNSENVVICVFSFTHNVNIFVFPKVVKTWIECKIFTVYFHGNQNFLIFPTV